MREQDVPAFPCNENVSINCSGLTKREYFAAMAMQGVVGLPWPSEREKIKTAPRSIAEISVAIADALIERLEQE